MTTEELLKALARLRVETGSLACLGCGYEHNCSVHGCALLSEAWATLDYLRRREDALYDEVKELWVEVNSRGNALRAVEQKRAEAEDERDALLPYAKEYGCDTCANEKACFVTTREGVTVSCVKCPVPDACPCSKCKDRDNWKWRGLPGARRKEKRHE